MTNNKFAEIIGINPTSIHRRVCLTGSFYGLRPQKLPNGRLLWPDDAVDQLTQREAVVGEQSRNSAALFEEASKKAKARAKLAVEGKRRKAALMREADHAAA